MDLIDKRNCYVVEGATDEDKLRKCGCDLIIKTGGKLMRDDVMRYIAAVAKVRRIVVVTDPDITGRRIREKIEKKIGDCRSVHTRILDSADHGKIGIAEMDMKKLRSIMASYVAEDEASKEADSFSSADMMEVGLTGSGSSERRQKIYEYLGFSFPDAKSLLRGLCCLGWNKDKVRRILDGNDERI